MDRSARRTDWSDELRFRRKTISSNRTRARTRRVFTGPESSSRTCNPEQSSPCWSLSKHLATWKNYEPPPLALIKFELKSQPAVNVTANLIRRVCGFSKRSPLIPMNVHVLDVVSPSICMTRCRVPGRIIPQRSRDGKVRCNIPRRGGCLSPGEIKIPLKMSIRWTASFYFSIPRTLKAFGEYWQGGDTFVESDRRVKRF